jgi:hypothetical protein
MIYQERSAEYRATSAAETRPAALPGPEGIVEEKRIAVRKGSREGCLFS